MRRILTAREQYALLTPWERFAYDIQSPAPGDPMQTKLGPRTPSLDPTADPMGHLNQRPYDYNTMVGNLVSHYHGANDDERKQGRLWYRAAHDMFHKFAKDNDITPERSVAYGSAFSPLTDWGDNVHHAQKFMLGYRPGDPDFNEHDWQTAHVHPGALDAFRQQNGRDPSDSTEDLHNLANLHSDAFKRGPSSNAVNDFNNPEARQNWIDNIQHKGIGNVLEDHDRQKEAWRKSPKTKGEYNPSMAMRPSGIATLGGNIQKAKDLYHAPEDVAQMFKVLGGPKISHFTDNILDDTPIDSQGYYAHPNGDWTQNKDLGGTIDSHHIRASSMAHGQWERKPYAAKNPSSDHEYDVFNRGLYDATKHINSQEADPTKHITPKQLQAIVWLKHKNDKDYFERQRNPGTGQLITHQDELGGAERPADWQFAEKSYKSKGKGLGKGPSAPVRAAALDDEDFRDMPPLWRKVFMSRKPQEWTDLLRAWVDHYSPEPPPDEDSGISGSPEDPRLGTRVDRELQAVQQALAYSSAIVKNSIPEHLDRKWKEDAMDTAMGGGLTLRDQVGDAPTSGYMVSLPKSEGHEEPRPVDDLSGAMLGDYAERKRDVINEDPDNYMGGWKSGPNWYNDVSRNYPDLNRAGLDAYRGDQKALWDLNRGREVGTEEAGWMTGAPWMTGSRDGD